MTERKDRFKSAARNFSQSAKSAGKAASKGAKTAGDVAARGAKSVGDTAAGHAKAAGENARQGMITTGDAATRVAGQGIRTVGDGVGAIRERAPRDSVFPEQIRNNLTDAIESSKTLSGSAKRRLSAQLGPALDRLSKDGMIGQAQAFAIIQGLMANPQISRELNGWLHGLVDGRTNWDQAMDAVYNQAHTGGSYHRLFDGGHTLFGAFQATREVAADVNIFKDASELIQALARDATTPRGLPLVTWDQNAFNSLADSLGNLGISKAWLNDLVSYDVVELIAGSIGILAVALNWNNDDVEEFSSLVSGMGLSAVVSANPLMLIVTVVALARAFHIARKSGDWKEFSDGLAKGGICTGAVLLVITSLSGPTVVILLAGLCVGIVAHQATENVSFVEIGQFMVREIRKASLTAESAIVPAKDVATPA